MKQGAILRKLLLLLVILVLLLLAVVQADVWYTARRAEREDAARQSEESAPQAPSERAAPLEVEP